MFTSKKLRMKAAKMVVKIEEFFYCYEDITMEEFNAFIRGQNEYLRGTRYCSKIEHFGDRLTAILLVTLCKDHIMLSECVGKLSKNEFDYAETLGYLDEMLKDVA